MNRRSLLVGTAAAVAVAAGGGWAWWRRRLPTADDALWSMSFDTPSGPVLSMASMRGKPLVLNFWATWCAPCVREIPQLDRFHREYSPRGWQVLGLALDRAEAVGPFLARLPVGFPIALGGVTGFDLLRRLGNNAAALPFSVVFDATGRAQHHKLGETDFDTLARWAEAIKGS